MVFCRAFLLAVVDFTTLRVKGVLVVLVVVEEVEMWCRRWCVCCRHLSLPLRPPDFGIYGQLVGLYSMTATLEE